MGEDQNYDRRIWLKQRITASVEELRQLHMKPTLDDFQNFWSNKLENSLLSLRQELRVLEGTTSPPWQT
jgi:hypothetical protein